MIRENVCFTDHFNRAQVFTSTPGHNGWASKITKTAGSPSTAIVADVGGAATLTCDNTSETQALTVYHADIKTINIGLVQRIRLIAKVTGIGPNTTICFGIAGSQNDTIASVTRKAWFKILGATDTAAIVVDTADGANANTGVASGVNLGAEYKEFVIDFQRGLADVRFYIDGDRIAPGTTFDMSGNTTDGYQPYLFASKTSTDAPILSVCLWEVDTRIARGA